jgi:nitrogen regulatory protein P-II 1
MKKIEAIIREEKLEAVRKALEKDSYFGITVSEVSGHGRQGGLTLQWRVGEYHVDLLPKVKLEVVILDEDVPRIVHTIRTTARTGDIGDGKIFVLPVEDAVRIRTGDAGNNAI